MTVAHMLLHSYAIPITHLGNKTFMVPMSDIRSVNDIFLCPFPIKSENKQKITFDYILLFSQKLNLPTCELF